MVWEKEDDYEIHQGQRRLALDTIDELMEIKLVLLDAGKPVPKFLNNAIAYLKKKYVTEEQTVTDYLMKR